MYDLRRSLADYDMAMLRALAQNRGVTLETNQQLEAVDHLATALLAPVSVRVALTRLSSQAGEALNTLLSAGGSMRAPQFFRQFGSIRPIGPGRLEREAPWQEPASPTEELWYAGLVYRAFSQDEDGAGEFVFIPDELLPLLPQPDNEAPALSLEPVPAPSHWQDVERALTHDLFTYLTYIYNSDVRPYADGRLAKRDLSALRPLLQSGKRRFGLIQHLARRLRFVLRQDEHLRLDATRVKPWLTASPERQIAMLQEAWRDDPTWNDLCHVPGLVCDRQAPWQNDPVATRQALLTLLAQCPLAAWWPVASFVAAVKEIAPDFQRPDGDYTSWYIRDADSGEYLSGFESWDSVEGALIVDLLLGPLHWLGVVATAGEHPAPICCLTDSGARFLGLVDDKAESPPLSPIAIQPDFGVQVPAPVSLYTRFQLERFADLESTDPCRYRLTVGALGRAMGRGLRIDQILAFLRQASSGNVPANVAGQLQMWAGRFDQVQLHEVALLTVTNERVMRELSVLPETRSLIGQVLSPTRALVRKRDLPRLRKALRDLGYLRPDDCEQGS